MVCVLACLIACTISCDNPQWLILPIYFPVCISAGLLELKVLTSIWVKITSLILVQMEGNIFSSSKQVYRYRWTEPILNGERERTGCTPIINVNNYTLFIAYHIFIFIHAVACNEQSFIWNLFLVLCNIRR